jgi:hypothetical protein
MRTPLRVALATSLALSALLTGGARAGTWDAIERLPNQQPVAVKVEGKSRLYFRLTPESPLVIPVEGPARVRIVSRVELPLHSNQVMSYRLRVNEEGKELNHSDTEASASDMASDPTGSHSVGKSRRLGFEVGPGMHRVTVSVEGAPALLVRLHRAAPARGQRSFVTLTPIDAPRSVTVIEGERSIPYASVMPGKPVKLRVVGPTTLDLITRLDFDASMRGTQTYRLGLFEGGRRLRVAAFKTTKATTATYPELKDRVPSKFDRLRLQVGEGVHEITVELLAPKQGAAEIHARIPEPQIGGQE